MALIHCVVGVVSLSGLGDFGEGIGGMGDPGVRAKVIAEVLSPHEQVLYRKHRRDGKSLGALAQLYRQYEGENGIRECLNRIEEKINQGVRARERGEVGGLERQLTRTFADDGDDSSGGIPVRRVPAGTLAGGGTSPAKPASTPPIRSASHPSQARDPSVGGSTVGSGSPTVPRRKGSRMTPEAEARDARVLDALLVRARSVRALGELLGVADLQVVRSSLGRLSVLGKAVKTDHVAFDWQGAGGGPGKGRSSVVWVAVGGPAFLAPTRDWEKWEAQEEKPPPKSFPIVDMPSSAGEAFTPTQRLQKMLEEIGALDREKLRQEIGDLRGQLAALEGLAAAIDNCASLRAR